MNAFWFNVRLRLKEARSWLFTPRPLARIGLITVCVVIGLMMGGLVFLGLRYIDQADKTDEELHKRDQQLAAAIRRINRLEHPSKADTQRAITQALKRFNKRQLQRLLRLLVTAAPPELRREAARIIATTPGAPTPPSARGAPGGRGGSGDGDSPSGSGGVPSVPAPQPSPPSRPSPSPRPPQPPSLPPARPLPQPIQELVCPALGQLLPPKLCG